MNVTLHSDVLYLKINCELLIPSRWKVLMKLLIREAVTVTDCLP